MKIIANTPSDLLPILCREAKAWGLYLSVKSVHTAEDPTSDAVKAVVPWADSDMLMRLTFQGAVYLTFETEAELREAFERIKAGALVGDVRAFALTCDPDGMPLDEHN